MATLVAHGRRPKSATSLARTSSLVNFHSAELDTSLPASNVMSWHMNLFAGDEMCNNPNPSSSEHEHSGCASPYAAPPVLTTTLNLRWMLVFEDPIDRTLWLGKAIPRVWWTPGKSIGVQNAPTRYGTQGISS